MLSCSHGSKQVLDEAVDVTKPNLVELNRGFAVLSRILMGRNFGDPIAPLQALHHHLLLNGGDVFLEIERANDLSANSAKTVLAFGEVLFPSHVNADENDVAANHAKQFVYIAMQFITAASGPRADDEIRAPIQDRLGKMRNIRRVMRSIRVHENHDLVCGRHGPDAN